MMTPGIVTIRTAGRIQPAQFKNRFKNSFDRILTVFDTHRTCGFESFINLPAFAQKWSVMNIGERLKRKGDKINFYYDYGRGPASDLPQVYSYTNTLKAL